MSERSALLRFFFFFLLLHAHLLYKSLQTNETHTCNEWYKPHKELEEAVIIPAADHSLKGQDHTGVVPLL